jgi:site-specific recombinase XerD
VVVSFPPDDDGYPADLPAWLGEPLLRWLHLRQRNWRPARRNQHTLRFWSSHGRLWRWLLNHYPIACLADLSRARVMSYADVRLAAGVAVSTVNQDILGLHGFLLYLQEQDIAVPQALLKLKPLKQPDRLPRFLTDDQAQALRDDLDGRVTAAATAVQQRDALLDRAAFYLMWHGGLRLGEVEELRTDDLDLSARTLMVRQGKGMKDRTVYLTDTAVRAVKEYLTRRGQGPTSHVFLYRNEPVHKDLLHCRIRNAGGRSGVKVTPHQLRHTYATQLLNAGCKVTSIQKLLGHQRLNSTMTYARVHDRTVAEDYYRAMGQVERSSGCDTSAGVTHTQSTADKAQLADVVAQLTKAELALAERLALVDQLRAALGLPITQCCLPSEQPSAGSP